MARKSHLEALQEFLECMSPVSWNGKLTTFAPFASNLTKPQNVPLHQAKDSELEKQGEKQSAKFESLNAEESGSHSLAKQILNQDFVCFDWLQEFGSPVCKTNIEDFLVSLATAIYRKSSLSSR